MNNLCSNLSPDGFDYAFCGGGNFFMSSAYLTRGSGPVQEADDPYLLPKPSNSSPTDLSPVLDVRDITFLPPRTGPLDNSMFQQTLMDEGAISVGFRLNRSCFADNDTTYYRPGEESARDRGHAVTWITGTCTMPGYHTISLPDAVSLVPGEVFSVVLKVSSPTDTYPLVVEMPIVGYSSSATAEPGESYLKIDGSWEDLATRYPDTNICIKAHTSPVTAVRTITD